MKKNILIVSFLWISSFAMAQTTITNTYFPAIGDTLKIATALPNLARFARITPAGANQTWNYSFLRSRLNSTAYTATAFIAPPANDTVIQRVFPTCNLATKQDSAGVTMTCYQKTATRFDLMGFKGFNTLGAGLSLIGLRVSPAYQPYALERRAPLSFGMTQLRTQSNFTVTIPASALPDSLLALLPVRPDSLRTRFQTIRTDNVDAWGSLRIPGGLYNVLREKRVEITDTKIEIRLPNLPIWLDVTALASAGQFLPQDTTTSYRFWAAGVKEPILELTASKTVADSVTNADYKYLPINTPTTELNTGGGEISLKISPNPTDGVLNIEELNIDAANYEIHIYNLNGALVAQQQKFVDKKTTIDVSNLASGTYILQLRQPSQQVIGIGKFVRQ
jgi:hypothetical protein